MRYVLPALLSLVGTVTVLACSSSDEKKDNGPTGTIIGNASSSGGSSSSSSGSSGPDHPCSGLKSLDCAKQTAHAKEAACTKFDEKQWTADCESENCATPVGCAKELKDLGDCLLAQPAVCDEAGGVDSQTPAACKDKDAALLQCDVNNAQ